MPPAQAADPAADTAADPATGGRPAAVGERNAGERMEPAAPPVPTVAPGAAGSYFVLFDAERRPLLGAFWIGDEVIGVAGGPAARLPTPASLQTVVVDRYLFPRAVVDAVYLRLLVIGYTGLPGDHAAPTPGRSFTVRARRLPSTLFRGDSDKPPFDVAFAWQDQVTRAVKGGALTGYRFAASHQFDFEQGGLREEAGTVERVYIPALGFGVSRPLWDRIAEAVVGRAVSSADLAFAIWLRAADISDAARACFGELRAGDDYAQYQAALAELEQRSQALIAGGLTDILANGLEPYIALEDRYRISRRFMACAVL